MNSLPDELINGIGETLKFENDACNEFQNYFSNIGLNLDMSVVPDSGDPTFESLPRDQIDVFLHLRLVTVDEINLSASDQITSKILKFIFPIISQV